jgi:hypothetical protein
MNRDDNREHRRTPGAGYVGVDADGAPGWERGVCTVCAVRGYVEKDLEPCGAGHLVCDDCLHAHDGCRACDGGDA